MEELLNSLNERLAVIRSDIAVSRRYSEHPKPGLTFFAPCLADGIPDSVLLLVLCEAGGGFFVCCKLSVETRNAGAFDLILGPKAWSGKYRVMIEAWNTVRLHEDDIGREFTDTVPLQAVSRALTLHDDFCSSELTDDPKLKAFQDSEAGLLKNILRKERRFSVIQGGKARIGQTFSIDRRTCFDFPYQMAQKTFGGKVVPVRNISPLSGEWDVIRSSGTMLNCLIPSGVITQADVKQTEIERIEWAEINRKVFAALSLGDVRKKIVSLENLFRSSGEDPYVAFNLAWILFFEKEHAASAEYVNRAAEGFPMPEFRDMAVRAKRLFESLPDDSALDRDSMANVWRIRCGESSPGQRIVRMKELWLRSFSGYTAYEIAVEYRYLGSHDPDNPDYGHYIAIRRWAERALSASDPLEQEMRRWPENMLKRIESCIESVPDPHLSDPPKFYMPVYR